MTAAPSTRRTPRPRSPRNGRPPWTPLTPTCAAAPSPPRPAAPTPSTPTSSPRWAGERGLAPAAVDVRALRRYVASLTESGQAPTTVARKLAALRGLFRHQVSARRAQREPRRPAQLPQALAAAAARAQGRRGGGAARPHPGHRPAGAARPRAVRAGLRLRPARRGARDPRRLERRLRRRDRPRGGQGRQDAPGPGGRARTGGARALSGPRAGRRSAPTTPRRCSCPSPAAGWEPRTSGGGCGPGRGWPRAALRRSATPIRTPCATRSRPICWRAEPTCGRSRSCSATPASPRLRFTLG